MGGENKTRETEKYLGAGELNNPLPTIRKGKKGWGRKKKHRGKGIVKKSKRQSAYQRKKKKKRRSKKMERKRRKRGGTRKGSVSHHR